jgi:hypothetical protein
MRDILFGFTPFDAVSYSAAVRCESIQPQLFATSESRYVLATLRARGSYSRCTN